MKNPENQLEEHQEPTDWEILGLPEGATLAEVKAAYRQAAKKAHPDTGGKQKDFVRATDAYHRLMEQLNAQKNKKAIPEDVVRRYKEANQPDLDDPDSDVDLWE